MSGRRTGRGRLAVAGFAAAGFSIALVALVSSQLALMSVLDTARADRAAEQIAESRFTADLIEQTVMRSLAPIAGDDVAQIAASAASTNPAVLRVVETSLENAHRQIVDPDAPADVIDGNLAVGTAIVDSVIDTATANGVDLGALSLDDPATIATNAGLPSVVPDDIPHLGLRRLAETTRAIALLAVLVFAVFALLTHPRPGRALRGLGLTVAIITGVWLVAMLAAGWIIGRFSDTLFGEMIDAVWSDAVPAMLLLVGAGVVIGVALVLAGVALDGYLRERRRRDDRLRQQYERFVDDSYR